MLKIGGLLIELCIKLESLWFYSCCIKNFHVWILGIWSSFSEVVVLCKKLGSFGFVVSASRVYRDWILGI